MSGLSRRQPTQIPQQKRRHSLSRDFIDPSKMAERKEVTDARMEGFIEGHEDGFKKGLAIGIACTALFFILVWTIGNVAQANAQNPDVPNAAFALDFGIGGTIDGNTPPFMGMTESKIRAAIIMPITDRFTVSARMDLKDMTLRKYQVDGPWKFRSQAAFWEIGCRVYIGSK